MALSIFPGADFPPPRPALAPAPPPSSGGGARDPLILLLSDAVATKSMNGIPFGDWDYVQVKRQSADSEWDEYYKAIRPRAGRQGLFQLVVTADVQGVGTWPSGVIDVGTAAGGMSSRHRTYSDEPMGVGGRKQSWTDVHYAQWPEDNFQTFVQLFVNKVESGGGFQWTGSLWVACERLGDYTE